MWRGSCRNPDSRSIHSAVLVARERNVDMKAVLVIALALFAPSFVLAQDSAHSVASSWEGRWQGTTVSGQPLVLELHVKAQRITGRLTVGKQSANITAGKALEDAFALTTGKIDGHTVDVTGRRVEDTIELTIDGVKDPLRLTRVN